MAISGSAAHGWRSHAGATDQVVHITIAVVIAAAQYAIVVVPAAGITCICRNFLCQLLHFFRGRIRNSFAVTSAVSVLIGNGSLVPVSGLDRVNSHCANRSPQARNKKIRTKVYIGMMEVMNNQAIYDLQHPIA